MGHFLFELVLAVCESDFRPSRRSGQVAVNWGFILLIDFCNRSCFVFVVVGPTPDASKWMHILAQQVGFDLAIWNQQGAPTPMILDFFHPCTFFGCSIFATTITKRSFVSQTSRRKEKRRKKTPFKNDGRERTKRWWSEPCQLLGWLYRTAIKYSNRMKTQNVVAVRQLNSNSVQPQNVRLKQTNQNYRPTRRG